MKKVYKQQKNGLLATFSAYSFMFRYKSRRRSTTTCTPSRAKATTRAPGPRWLAPDSFLFSGFSEPGAAVPNDLNGATYEPARTEA